MKHSLEVMRAEMCHSFEIQSFYISRSIRRHFIMESFLSAWRQRVVPEDKKAKMTEENKEAKRESTAFCIWYIMRSLSQDHRRSVLKNK